MPMSAYLKGIRDRIGHDMLLLPTTAVLTFDARNRVLLVMHGDVKRWTTPGGCMEPGESPSDSAVREMWEETGLHVELTRLLGVYGGPEFHTRYANGDLVTFALMVFEGRPIGGELRADGDETLEARYFAEGEIDSLEAQPWVSKVLHQSFTQRDTPNFAQPTWSPPD